MALLVRTDAQLRRTVVGRVPVGPHIPYVHDFSVTASGKAILILPPIRITDVGDLTRGPFFEGLKWMADELATQVYVFDLSTPNTEPVATYNLPPLFTYHHVNAFDRPDGGVTVDVCGYSSPDIITGAHAFCYLSNMQDPATRSKQVSSGGRGAKGGELGEGGAAG